MRIKLFTALGLAAVSACLPTYEPEGPKNDAPAGAPKSTDQTSSGAPQVRPLDPAAGSSLFLDSEDASILLDRIADEGPPEQASRLHSCMKVKFDTLGRLLASRGVSMGALPLRDPAQLETTARTIQTTKVYCAMYVNPPTATTLVANNAYITSASQSARFAYCDSRGTLGLPQYGARLSEPMVQTTASATKTHDLFLAAAPEVIANFATTTDCRYQDQGMTKQAQLFDAQNRCDPVGVACLIGYVPGSEMLSLCNEIVQSAEATPPTSARPAAGAIPAIAATPGADALTTGKRVAVAALLAAAHMCE